MKKLNLKILSIFWIGICLFFGMSAVRSATNITALIPSQFVDSLLKDYSEEERLLIADDLANIEKLCFRGCLLPKGQPIYLATAGGPGASKSTILETYLKDKPNFVYGDPDQRALRFMVHTYLASTNNYAISQSSSFGELLHQSYKKWRDASNYIACTILNRAFAKGYNIAHGTTSTAKEVAGLYDRLKQKGYRIILLLCGSTDDNRIKALQHRAKEQDFIQNAAGDAITKGQVFPERFPIYFQFADAIEIYWTEEFNKGSVKAATIERGKKVAIHDPVAYNKFLEQYPTIEPFVSR